MEHTEYMIELTLDMIFDNAEKTITLHVHPEDVYEIEALGALIGSNTLGSSADCKIVIDDVKRVYYEEVR